MHLPEPAESSVGPQRTRQAARKARRHDPAKPAKKKAKPEKEDWNPTLSRFRSHFDPLFSVQNGRPSGGLEPEMALADISKIVKDDLKQSVSGFFYCVLVHHFTNLPTSRQPLQGKKSGEGKRKARSAEDYLKGLLRALSPVEPAPTTAPDAEFAEDDTAVALLSRGKCCFASLRFYVAN